MLSFCGKEDKSSGSEEHMSANDNNNVPHKRPSTAHPGLVNEVTSVILTITSVLAPDCSPVVRYGVIELLKRFYPNHIKDVKQQLEDQQLSPGIREATEHNLRKQGLLRLLTCILIMVKYDTSCSKTIQENMKRSLQILATLFPTACQPLLFKSEFRVLNVRISCCCFLLQRFDSLFFQPQSVKFEVVKGMPFPIFQVLIAVLDRNQPDLLSPTMIKNISSCCNLLCDLYYLRKGYFHRIIR
jgi:hypothetical protein